MGDGTQDEVDAVNILDSRFKWNQKTDVQETWRKHGWKPTTEQERRARQRSIDRPRQVLKSVHTSAPDS